MTEYRVHMTRFDDSTKQTQIREITVSSASHVADATNQAISKATEIWGPGWIVSRGGVRYAAWTSREQERILNTLERALSNIYGAFSEINIQMPIGDKTMEMHMKALNDEIKNLRDICNWYGRD